MLGFADRILARSGLALIGAACAFLLLGCTEEGAQANGEKRSEARELPTFTSIRVDGAVGMTVDVGKPQSVEIDTSEDMLEKISTEVVDGTLLVTIDQDGFSWGDDEVKLDIAVEKLESFDLNGAGGIEITGIDSETFNLSIEGAGGMDVSGKCGTATYSIDGAGGMDASNLICENVTISLEGAGGAEVYASNSFTGRIDGIGGIDVQGKPKEVTKNVNGIGGINVE